MSWWWLSLVDLDAPLGHKLIGCAIVSSSTGEHPDWDHIVALSLEHDWRIDPATHVEIAGFQVSPEFGPPPAEWDHKLLRDKARIAELEMAWIGEGCTTIGEWRERQATP